MDDNSNNVVRNITSDIASLKEVMIHRPDNGISRMVPSQMEELLFDDLVFLKRMQSEHDVFTDLLRAFLGKEHVHDTLHLLANVLENGGVKHELLTNLAKRYNVSHEDIAFLSGVDKRRLSTILISGYDKKEDRHLLPAIPNYIFTRDLGVIVKDQLIIAKSKLSARKREYFLTNLIYQHHPIFASFKESGNIIEINSHPDYYIEGGDFLMIEEDCLMIACSERTSEKAFEEVKEQLFEKGTIEKIVKVVLPSQRAYKHLNSVITKVDDDLYVAYQSFLNSKNITVTQYSKDIGVAQSFDSPFAFFNSLSMHTKFVFAGNGKSPYDEREQWTSACNILTLRKGLVIAFERNTRTSDAFKALGYEVIKAKVLLEEIKAGTKNIHQLEKTIISLPSSELSRARGGPMGFTFALSRQDEVL